MFLEQLNLKKFRNYDDLKISLNNGLNIFYGDNAQGKTNILESIYFCATGKSHRTKNDKELIKWENENSKVNVKFIKNDREEEIDILIHKNVNKKIMINKIKKNRTSEIVGNLNIVIFSPEDLYLIKEGPSYRRKYIDIEISQVNNLYLQNLIKYNKILKNRNFLLKEKNITDIELNIWDEQLVSYGKKLIVEREKFINDIKDIVKDIYYKITGEKEILEISYEKNIDIENYREKLNKNIEKDKVRKRTSIGPHLDDIEFKIDGVDIRKYGSQGQQRTAAIALKFAAIDFFEKEYNVKPILLLDDIFSELDKNRQLFLIEYIKDIQTILTCTGVDDLIENEIDKKYIFKVEKGTVKKC